MKYYTALTIAGSDSCGGAGIQADIKTMSALGVYASSAITAITVQNTKGVYGIQNVEPEIVKGQIEAVMDDIHPDAIKIGMVNDCDTIRAITETLKKYEDQFQHLVIDPVMVSTSGCRLMQEDALDVFINDLLPLATLLTPTFRKQRFLPASRFRMWKISRAQPQPSVSWDANTCSSRADTSEETRRLTISSKTESSSPAIAA